MQSFERNLREQIDGANRNAKGLTVELEQKIESILEKTLVARVDKIEKLLEAQKGQIDGHIILLESLHQVKPGEQQTLMTLFSWLDAEVKRLDQEPKAQKIFDEAQKAIHEAVSETKRE